MRKVITFTVVSLLTASAFGAGEVYRWRGADGAWHYSDMPRAGAELVRQGTPFTTPPPAETTAAPAAPAVPAAPTGPVTTTQADPATGNIAAQVRAEAEAIKKDQCTKAEAAYQSAITARRIYRTDADGKTTYMTEAEIDAARLQARANRDLACGPGA